MVHRSILKSVTNVILVCATLSIILCSARGGYAMPDKSCTRDGASVMVEQFVKNDETFKFDGLKNTLSIRVEHANSLADVMSPQVSGVMAAMTLPLAQNEYTFKAKFDSRHSGYGDRTGKYLAEVITPHEAEITVENCQIKSAIMDGKWDMLTEERIES